MSLYQIGFYGLLSVAPLLLGSNRPILWGLNGIVAAAVVASFVWTEVQRRKLSRFDWRLPMILMAAFLATSLWIIIQASHWTPTSWHHPIWFTSLLLADAKGAISANPSRTWQTLGWLSSLSIFIVAVRQGTTPARSVFALKFMLGICVLVAFFGLVVERFNLNTLGLLPKIWHKGWLTGTFVNRNSAASFIGIGLIIAIVLATRPASGLRKWRESLSALHLAGVLINRTGFYAAIALGLFFTLLLTGSRGGIATGIIGAALVFGLRTVKLQFLRAPAVGAIILAVAVSTGLAMGSLKDRTDAAESNRIRLSLYREAVDAIADRPLLGHGAGTYLNIQPLYHSSSTPSDLVWDHAHSTVLESILTLGFPAMALVAAVLIYVLANLASTWRKTPEEAPCILVALAASVTVMLHAFVDFSLQIQAIALYMASLTGLGIGEAMALDAALTASTSDRSTRTSSAASARVS
jgi:O-antigen ligase